MRKLAGILKGVGGWIGVVAAIVLGLTGSVGATTLDSSLFNESCDIRVAGYSGSETLTDFQVLVRLKENSPAGFSYADAGTDGEEIRFADSDGNLIPHEIQTWAPTGETLIWVKLPSLIGTNTTFTMYWSAKDGATLPAVTASDTWSNYVGVWHFEGDTGDAADSSPNGYTATYNGTDYVPLEQGPIGRGATLAASKRFVTAATQLTSSSAARPLSSASKMTLSGWFYIDGAADNGSHTYFSKGSWNNGGWSVFPKNKTTMCLCGASSSAEISSFRDAFGKWVHCTFVFNGSTLSAYCNGGDTMSGSGSGSSAGDKTSYALSLFGYSGRTGKGDEMRVYNGTASATRILADYQVQINRRFLEFKRREALDAKLFNRQANIRVAGYKGSETLKDFQVLVRVTAGQPGGFFYEDVAANGADIRFADADGKLIPHEIQTWNTSGESLIWVKLPLLAGTNTTFSMHWDAKDGATIPSVTAADTWSNYIGVWHFEDDTADAADSTANGYTATANIPDYSPTEAGVVGRARTVPKSTNLVVTGSTQLMTPMVPNSLLTRQRLTLSGWMKLASTDSASNNYTFMSKGGWNTGGFTIFYKSSTLMCVCGGSNSAEITFPNVGGNWVYVTAVYNGTTAYGYANGGAVSGSAAIGATGDNPSYSLSLFGYGARTGFGDEFRFYNGVESPARIKADYDTQVSPTFLVYEANADDSDPAGYKYRTRMEVAGYTGASVLGDFPVLVRLSEGSPSGFSYLDCQSDGSDLLFADADGNAIPHEIDTWNPGGESLVWVKLPKLLPGGTTFYMQYSVMNGLRPAAVKSTDVWTSYVGVWHFSEGTGAEKDSTLNNRTANYTGGGTYAPIENGGVGRGGTPSFTVAGSSKLTTGCAQPLSNPQKFTVSMWTKIATFSAYNPMMKGGYSSSGTSWYLEKRTDLLIVGPGVGGYTSVSYATVADQWTHYTVVLNGTAVSEYAMGAFIGSGTISPAAADNELYSLWFGGSGCDEVRIYNGTVTADRAKADYETMADVDFVSASAVEERCMYARFDSIELDDSPAAVATYTVVWPGEGAESAAVSAEFWEVGGSVTNSVGLAAAATGSGSAVVPVEWGHDYEMRLVFTSSAGTLRTDTRTLRTKSAFTFSAPTVDSVNRTIRFTGSLDTVGVGDTTLKLYYGRSPSACTNEISLASAYTGDEPAAFDTGLIHCDAAANPMPSVWYRYEFVQNYALIEIQRVESEIVRQGVFGYSDDWVECDDLKMEHETVDGNQIYTFSNAVSAATFRINVQPFDSALKVVGGGAAGAVIDIPSTNLTTGAYSVTIASAGTSSFGSVTATGGTGGGGKVIVTLQTDSSWPEITLAGEPVADKHRLDFQISVDDLGAGIDEAEVSVAYALAGQPLGAYQSVKTVDETGVFAYSLTGLAVGTTYDYSFRIDNGCHVRYVSGTAATTPNVGSGGRIEMAADGSGDAVHIFDTAGEFTFTAPPNAVNLRFLIVGGGGAGGLGTSNGNPGGGGGGGGVLTNDASTLVAALGGERCLVVVGAGGVIQEANLPEGCGEDSSLTVGTNTFVGIGGGAGGRYTFAGMNGGNAGGGGSSNKASGTPTQTDIHGNLVGFAGGTAHGNGGGGGGGAGQAAYMPNGDGFAGGHGGDGAYCDITGVNLCYGGGGGGGNRGDYNGNYGGAGGGGRGACTATNGVKGGDGLGGGGGGGGGRSNTYRPAGNGGCGTVIIRYTPPADALYAVAKATESLAGAIRFSVELVSLGASGDNATLEVAYGADADHLGAYTTLTSALTVGFFEYLKSGIAGSYLFRFRITNNQTSEVITRDVSASTAGLPGAGGDRYEMSDGSIMNVFTEVGTNSFVVPAGGISLRYLIVGGGGAGAGSSGSDSGGGGGGGGVLTNLTAQPLALAGGTELKIVVGAGGVATYEAQYGGNGGDSAIIGSGTDADVQLIGYGGGGGGRGTKGRTGGNGGGSGNPGGVASQTAPDAAGRANGTTVIGFAGGIDKGPGSGGGGGAGGIGVWVSGSETFSGNQGGPGAYCDITGANVCYGGGGGGGHYSYYSHNNSGGIGGGGCGGLYLESSTGIRYNARPGTDGLGGGGGGAGGNRGGGYTEAQRTPQRGGSGIVIIRYMPSTTMPDEPFAALDGLSVGDDGSIQVAYSAFWAGKNCDSVKVEAFYGLDENSLTGTVTFAESTIGEGVGVLQVPLDVEPLRYFVKLRFTSAAGECVTKVSSIVMPALYLPTLPAPIVDRQAMTVQFAGTASPLGFGTTTLSVEYGGTDALGHSLELGSADEADGQLDFSTDPIACYHRIRTQRMKHVYYRYVYVITAGDRELYRTTSDIRRVLVCNLPTIFYVK